MCADLADVEVIVTEFDLSSWEAQQLVSRARIFIGFHGAGLANMLWAPPGSVLVQLLSYGWIRPYGQPLLGKMFDNLALAASAHYLEWTNDDASRAFLYGKHHKNTLLQHPTKEMLPTHNVYAYGGENLPKHLKDQHTDVDPVTFRPVLQETFRLVGIPLMAHNR